MICPRCKGKRICDVCKGTGMVSGARGMYEINVGAPGVPKSRPCPDPPRGCGGTGVCPRCGGDGEID
jgi:hypothetical protein